MRSCLHSARRPHSTTLGRGMLYPGSYMDISMSGGSYWSRFARSFGSLGPPLRPCREDLEVVLGAVAEATVRRRGRPLRALLLGVTPELAAMTWAEQCTLLAADGCLPMLQAVWPGDVPQRRWAICADWRKLPLYPSSLDVVAGDGSANCLRYPDGLRVMASGLRDLIAYGGRLVLRCYLQRELPETPEEVFGDVNNPALPSFHHFKFRLLMAMQADATRGVRVNEVYRAWRAHLNNGASVHLRPGWEARDVETIEFYRDADTIHTFPTLDQFRMVLDEFFDEIAIHTPRYTLGERCPTLVLSPRPIASR
jgi:hypothetical protein